MNKEKTIKCMRKDIFLGLKNHKFGKTKEEVYYLSAIANGILFLVENSKSNSKKKENSK